VKGTDVGFFKIWIGTCLSVSTVELVRHEHMKCQSILAPSYVKPLITSKLKCRRMSIVKKRGKVTFANVYRVSSNVQMERIYH